MITMLMKTTIALIFFLFLSACSFYSTSDVKQGAEIVRLYDTYEAVEDCQFISEVIGTEGRWYSYLFISNRDLTQGAVNDLKNQARKIGANAVHIHTDMFFATSVTMLGQAYDCRK